VILIDILPLGEVAPGWLEELRAGLATEFPAKYRLLPREADPAYAFNPSRQQYWSTDILAHLNNQAVPNVGRLLAVTCADLYIPILTFVFGEAQVGGPCAVVSTHRLREEVYGLPSNPQLFQARLLKEAVHEIGHTFGLTHCLDTHCAMAASHSVEWIDLKSSRLCERCQRRLGT
jgi:archaemetzincin